MSKPKQIYLFNNERFAIVRPRLVAGLFIRKGCSLPFVEGVCMVSVCVCVCVNRGVTNKVNMVNVWHAISERAVPRPLAPAPPPKDCSSGTGCYRLRYSTRARPRSRSCQGRCSWCTCTFWRQGPTRSGEWACRATIPLLATTRTGRHTRCGVHSFRHRREYMYEVIALFVYQRGYGA